MVGYAVICPLEVSFNLWCHGVQVILYLYHFHLFYGRKIVFEILEHLR